LQYQKKISHIKENYFYCGGQFSLKKYIQDYVYYDYTDALAYIKLKYIPINSGLLRSEYNFYYRKYSNLSDYDYIENRGDIQYNQFLKTRTTLRTGIDFGNKYYNSLVLNDSISVKSTSQLTGTFLIAQSITRKTGIQFQYNYIYNITQSENYIDDSYYDDKYNYSGFEYIGGLTQIFPYNISVILKGGYNYHNYEERPILNRLGVPLLNIQNRIDKISYGNLRLEKEFSNYFYLFIDYSYKRSTSNDDFYNYTNSIYSMGLNFSL
jgi:hypothetical protein